MELPGVFYNKNVRVILSNDANLSRRIIEKNENSKA